MARKSNLHVHIDDEVKQRMQLEAYSHLMTYSEVVEAALRLWLKAGGPA